MGRVGERDGWGNDPQLLSLTHAGICWDAAHPPRILCYQSTEDLALLHYLPLQVQHYVLTSASLWAHANHVPVLHAMLSSKKSSWGHWPYTLHMLLSTAPRCQDEWRTTQEFLPPFQVPPRVLSVDILPPGCPKTTWIYCQLPHPASQNSYTWESWDPFKGTAPMYISSFPNVHFCCIPSNSPPLA